MKLIAIFAKSALLFYCLAVFLSAKAEVPEEYAAGTFAFDIGVGTNLGLSSLNAEQTKLFEARPSTGGCISFRPSYFLTRHWGIYASIGASLFRFHKNTKAFDALFPGISLIKPALSAGGTYRFEHSRWQIQPRLGIGISSFGNKESKKTINGMTVYKKRSGDVAFVDAGTSFAYRTSRICSLFIDVAINLPITPAKSILTETSDGEPSKTMHAESYTWERAINISAGIRFQTSSRQKY